MVKPARTLIFFPHSAPEKMLGKKMLGKNGIFLPRISSGLDSSEYKLEITSIHFAGSCYKLNLKSKNLVLTLHYQTAYKENSTNLVANIPSIMCLCR